MTRRHLFTLLSLPVLVSGVALASVRFTSAAPGGEACVPVPGCCAAGPAACAPATSGTAAVAPEAAAPLTAPAPASDPCAGQPVCCIPGC
jgi:hypothetical protein